LNSKKSAKRKNACCPTTAGLMSFGVVPEFLASGNARCSRGGASAGSSRGRENPKDDFSARFSRRPSDTEYFDWLPLLGRDVAKIAEADVYIAAACRN
jgi:hypothetical protein